jgi:hypothetical protein
MAASKMSTMTRTISAVLALAAISVVVLYLLLLAGAGGNLGFEIGYYGTFNRVRRLLEESAEWRVKSSWVHEDVSLEDFEFTVENRAGGIVRVNFRESEIKELPTDEKSLRAYVLNKIGSSSEGRDNGEVDQQESLMGKKGG